MRPSSLSLSAKARSSTGSALNTSLTAGASNLTKAQKKGIISLENYIAENVKGNDAIKMAKDLAALRLMMEMNNSFAPKRSSAYDMTSDLFGGTSIKATVPGSLYNQLF